MTVTSLNGGCGGGPKRVASAVEGAREEVEAARSAELVSAAVAVAGGAFLVAADVVMAGFFATAASPWCILVPFARPCRSASRARAVPYTAEAAAACASATIVVRLRSSSSAVARASSAATMSAWWRAETCASISVELLEIRH